MLQLILEQSAKLLALLAFLVKLVEPVSWIRAWKSVDYDALSQLPIPLINLHRVGEVLDAYEKPPHDWGGETAWRLFNATTYALTGRVAENPGSTRQLHNVIDSICLN